MAAAYGRRPLGAIVAPLAARILPERRDRRPASLDPLGAAGIAVALSLMLVPLTVGRTQGWPARTWISLAIAAPTAAATLVRERLLARSEASPVLELSLLRSASFAGGLTAAAGLGMRGLARRHGGRVALAGSLVATAGLAMLVTSLAAGGDAVPVGSIALALLVTGAGNGLVHPSILGIALRGVPAHHAGAGSGMVVTARQLAGSVGVAGLGALFFAALLPTMVPTAMRPRSS